MGFSRLIKASLLGLAATLGFASFSLAQSPTTVPTTTLDNDLVVTGNLWPQGNVSVTGNLTVAGTSTYTGGATYTGAVTAPSLVLTGTSHNGTVQVAAGIGQASTFTIPDPGGSTGTFALLQTANTFTGVNTFPATGIVLKGTSFNGTLQELAGLGQATTYTLPDPGAATANVLLDQGVTSAVTIQHVSVPLTAANLIAMEATPVQLIAAGAAGTNIVVHHVMFTMNRTSTAFTGGGAIDFQIGNTTAGGGTQTTATVAATVLTTAGAGTTYTTVIPVSYTGTAATGLFISNATAPFAAGTGTATVDIWYSIK
jgi:hypothetical protein